MNDIFAQDEADAANTRCEKCNRAYEVVRPGKIQPTCACDYMQRMEDENADLRGEIERLKEVIRVQDIVSRERLAGLDKMTKERDNFKYWFSKYADAVDRVFQKSSENPNPILPDFLHPGDCKLDGIVRLAKEFAATRAAFERLTKQRDAWKQSFAAATSELDRQGKAGP